MINPDEVRTRLTRLSGLNMDEIYHVTTFRCYRRASSGAMQTVIVEIHDAGPDGPADLRYSCMALAEDGQFATGNPGPSVEVAFAIVHWGELDRPPVDKGDWHYWPLQQQTISR